MRRFFIKFLTAAVIATVLTGTDTYAAPQPEISAEAAILVDAGTGSVIYSKNAQTSLYPASITKLMTILLTLEFAGGDYSAAVNFSENAVNSLPWDSSSIAMYPGETLTLEECFYAILLASANEVANAVAEHIGGSSENFAVMMSNRAKELGCANTNFTNPHGLHDEGHYTCAGDMAIIMRECIKHPDFIRFIQTSRYDIAPTQKQPDIRIMNNTNKLIQQNSEFYTEEVIGGKTGFTDEAGHTLVTYAQKGDAKLVCVVMKTPKNGIYTDTRSLINYGFEKYKETDIFNADSYTAKLPVMQNSSDTENITEIEVKPQRSVSLFLPDSFNVSDVEQTPILPKKLFAPVTEGEKVGHMMLMYNGVFLADIDLLSCARVDLIPVSTAAPAQITPVSAIIPAAANEPEEDTSRKEIITVAAFILFVFILVVITFRLTSKSSRYRPRISGYGSYRPHYSSRRIRSKYKYLYIKPNVSGRSTPERFKHKS
ncbi:MAG: D-alanyl-D-alanine carboxypeptidase [Clostridiales bacterium]|jgi:D-alanyl-D-alanine carboxypeptidase|nr:D-alanyl-D-alanine carboxypeptidase [Clostridiales bacterium]